MRLTQRARALRQQMTPQEVRMWLRLRALRKQGLHFRRQAPFGNFILDFVCFDRRLVVEIDGAQHGETRHAEADVRRDGALAAAGFETLRFWNSDVNENIESVIETVFVRAMMRVSRAAPPSPAGERRETAI